MPEKLQIPTSAQIKTSYFNTAAAQMERIAENQKASNEYQFKRDYANWARVIEILFKEVYSKCTDKEIENAHKKIQTMNNSINRFSSRANGRLSNQSQLKIYDECWQADSYIRILMENHKLGSPAKGNIFEEGVIQE